MAYFEVSIILLNSKNEYMSYLNGLYTSCVQNSTFCTDTLSADVATNQQQWQLCAAEYFSTLIPYTSKVHCCSEYTSDMYSYDVIKPLSK